jgi:hypothetical protein
MRLFAFTSFIFFTVLSSTVLADKDNNDVRSSSNFRRSLLTEGSLDDKMGQLIDKDKAAQAQKLSTDVRDSMKKFRGGTREFYDDLFKAIQIKICDNDIKNGNIVSNPITRFVSSDDPQAYLNDDEKCIRIKSPELEVQEQYDNGFCEVKPNCYWAEINQTMDSGNRYPIYSMNEGLLPVEGSLTLAQADETLEKWATGLVIFIAPGIVLSVLSFLTMALFLFCRCCCNKCGGRAPKPEGYSCVKKLLPIFFFVAFSGAIAGTAGGAMMYNQQVSTAVTDVFAITDKTLTDTVDWIRTARSPLVDIKDTVVSSVIKIRKELNGTDFIEYGLDGLTTRLEDFGENTANVKLPRKCNKATDSFCFECGVCTTISDTVKKSTTQMKAAASTGIDKLAKVRTSLNTDLVDISDSIKFLVST